jgi:hypothetical protein
MTRRQFLKLKLYALVGLSSSSLQAGSFFRQPQTDPYAALDELLRLPFSDETMQEISLRVALQKKYGYDANGKRAGLHRFFREIGYFILSNRQEADFKTLYAFGHEHIDRVYYFNKAAQCNNIEAIRYMKQKLIGINDALLNEALLLAFGGRSVDTTIELLRCRVPMAPKTEKMLLSMMEQETSRNFLEKLYSTSERRLLPTRNTVLLPRKKRKFYKRAVWPEGWYAGDDMENRANIVRNALIDLYSDNLLDDLRVVNRRNSQMRTTLEVDIWSYSGTYNIGFIDKFDAALRFNGFEQDFLYDENWLELPVHEKRTRMFQQFYVNIH